jgi:hypothetical protein
VFGSIGTVGLIVALIAAGIALRSGRGAPLAVPVLLAIAGFLIAAHPPPFGPTRLVVFAGAVLLLMRSDSRARMSVTSTEQRLAAPR